MTVTQERVRELFDYNEETGDLIHKVGHKRAPKGSVVSVRHGQGYLIACFDNTRLFAHRLIWLWKEGYLPENEVDHINRIKDDNRWSNLRHISCACNRINSKMSCNNTSGITGVSWHKLSGRWVAYIKVNSKALHLGSYDSILDAAKARYKAEIDHGFYTCKSKSSAFRYLQEHSHEV